MARSEIVGLRTIVFFPLVAKNVVFGDAGATPGEELWRDRAHPSTSFLPGREDPANNRPGRPGAPDARFPLGANPRRTANSAAWGQNALRRINCVVCPIAPSRAHRRSSRPRA